ncbi:helix-turn-helix transcriptional regulator [Geochorda subterranea]|uniref:Helix-turn-helix transcriptional regulator n=1 Tax=Geochorda subterranea TaxID=3109564 RepID=A0ABZ1BR96_9FIRM|nr:helix-turn-helix transcriptional regulator [Limnochorda sp. LNt]WRP15325.1 helix-turn-helix transcriptional regulator [Limnochorda sp. LNt]
MELQARIGQRIRRRREELGMTQQELAGRELTRGFISQLEKGIVMPSLKSLELIASRLYKPVAYFLEDSLGESTPDTQRWLVLERALWQLLDGEARPVQELASRLASGAADGLARADDGFPALDILAGLLALVEGRPDEGSRRLAPAVRALRASGPSRLLALVLAVEGSQLARLQRWPEAVEALEEARRLLPDGSVEEACLGRRLETWLAVAYAHAGRTEEALPLLESLWQQAGQQHQYIWPGDVLMALGLCYAARGDEARALEAWERAAGLGHLLGSAHLEASALALQAASLRERGEGARALETMERACAVLRQTGQAQEAARLEVELVRMLFEQGQGERALARAAALMDDPATPAQHRARLLLVSGQSLARMGRVAEAIERLERAAELAQAERLGRELAAACSELGRLLREQGQHDRASEYLARALDVYEQTLH